MSQVKITDYTDKYSGSVALAMFLKKMKELEPKKNLLNKLVKLPKTPQQL